MSIKLSICIPTYNRGKFLPELFESILSDIDEENRGVIEVCVSDNASNDNTEEVILGYRKKFEERGVKFTHFRWQTNMGADRNFLKVVEIASGEYCWLMGSDDRIVSKSINNILKEISEVSIILGDRINSNINLIEYEQEKFLNIDKKCIFDFSKKPDIIGYFSKVNNLGGLFSYLSAIIVKKEEWDNILDYKNFIGTFYVHSYILLSILKKGSKIKYLNYPIVINRCDNDSFLADGYLKRVLIDFNGYLEISKIFDDDLIRNEILKILRKTYPFYRLIKIIYYIRKNHENISQWMNLFELIGWNKYIFVLLYPFSYFYLLLIWIKKKTYFTFKRIFYEAYKRHQSS